MPLGHRVFDRTVRDVLVNHVFFEEVHELKPFLRRARSVVRNLDVIGTRVGLVGLIIAFDQEVFFFW